MNRGLSLAAIGIALATVALGCAWGPPGQQAAAPAASPSGARRDDNVITRAEIQRAEVSNAYDAIVRLRPGFLRFRGNATVDEPNGVLPHVYIGADRGLGEVAAVLRDVDVARVEEIRYIKPTDAQTLYGIGHVGGVIQIVLRKRP